ncbi:hypothetical protein C499_01305 [Halogeometricum borinquense DSM 11551]|uniref:Uncharacterized protein n=1 Tax=Halogeometricum borinquense (strain ATCC 700274 / DSM 11551 / JCM 10706 / KCTC 4070 / PR3) TaxID=469382 RepID=L9V4T2_HALBP|nr:hypothetical protein C499_01305 [Halogeometricum borinquense DSM 11551]
MPTANQTDVAVLISREVGVELTSPVVVRLFRAGVLPTGGAELLPYEPFETLVHRYPALGTPGL